MKNQQGIVWTPILIIIGAVMVAGFATYFLIQASSNNKSENSNTNVAAVNQSNSNSNEDRNVDLSKNPSYCQTDDNCVAVPNPSNPCYLGYFNKNASEAIEKFKNNPGLMVQDCPRFGEVKCKENQCTADRQ